jgi:hypothetical protein
MSFKKFLIEQETTTGYTGLVKNRIAIYDFDGTLFRSPDREEGSRIYQQATGQPWPYQGWWGRAETLMPPIVPEVPGAAWFIDHVVKQQRADSADPKTTTILMTGRPNKIRERVKQILDSHGLRFDQYFFRGQRNSVGNDTFEIKANYIQDLITPDTTTIEIWEDRPEHVTEFWALAEKLKANHGNLAKIYIHDATTGSIQNT